VTSIGGYVGWTNLSDGRFKQNIQQDVKGLDFILQLKPVTYSLNLPALNQFLYAKEESTPINNSAKSSFRYSGFIAQEVDAAAQAVGYDFSGIDKPKNSNDYYGLRYGDFVVPLVKAVQEQQKMIETLQQQNTALKKELEKIKKNLEL
jgi:hypothetical protein